MSQIKGWPFMLHFVLLFFCIFKKTMLKMHKLHMKLRNIIFLILFCKDFEKIFQDTIDKEIKIE